MGSLLCWIDIDGFLLCWIELKMANLLGTAQEWKDRKSKGDDYDIKNV
jgi:hypothetical protein